MLGGEFRSHPCVRPYMVSVDEKHPITRDLKGYAARHWERWPVYKYTVTDEQYLLDYDPRVRVLASAVFRGVLWHIAWVKPWGQARSSTSPRGHDLATVKQPLFRQMLIGDARSASDSKPCEVEPTDRYAIW